MTPRFRTIILMLILLVGFGTMTGKAGTETQIELRVPASMEIGKSYDVELVVMTDSPIPDAVLKFSVPLGLVVTAGETHYRGTITVGGFHRTISVQVWSAPEAPLAGMLYRYD